MTPPTVKQSYIFFHFRLTKVFKSKVPQKKVFLTSPLKRTFCAVEMFLMEPYNLKNNL